MKRKNILTDSSSQDWECALGILLLHHPFLNLMSTWCLLESEIVMQDDILDCCHVKANMKRRLACLLYREKYTICTHIRHSWILEDENSEVMDYSLGMILTPRHPTQSQSFINHSYHDWVQTIRIIAGPNPQPRLTALLPGVAGEEARVPAE